MNKLFVVIGCSLLVACSAQRSAQKETGGDNKIAKAAERLLFKDSTIANAHIGISIYDADAGKYLYNYQGNKYFVPASNVKIFSCYTALKYLRDSVPGIQHIKLGDTIYLIPTGDPTLLHKDYSSQPVLDFVKKQTLPMALVGDVWKDNAIGFGWTADDYNSSYAAERSPLPVYGNVIRFIQTESNEGPITYTDPEINWKLNFNPDPSTKVFAVRRERSENIFRVTSGIEKLKEQEVPFVTNGLRSAAELLKDATEKDLGINVTTPANMFTSLMPTTIYSRPLDSLLRPMMHRSDNFFAEQVVLMASYLKLGVMDDSRIMDSILNSDLRDLPQRPRWVDGSGLSRYNLFTPQDFVWILNKMKQEFPFERLKGIFATGGQGTIRDYYKADSGRIFAKTGTLSGHVALSGYMITRSNKTLIFSVIVNNHNGSAPAIRRQVEQFLMGISKEY